MRSVEALMMTDGLGYWSRTVANVKVIGLDVPYIEDLDEGETAPSFGELQVYFDTKTWNTEVDGLIYTDKTFLMELHDYLMRAGYDASDVGYSEQGMQGDNYVSLDVGRKFLSTWIR